MALRSSAVVTVGLVLGTLLGLAPGLYLWGPGLSPGVAVFLGIILCASLLPWCVFAAAQRTWPRPLAVAVLVAIGGLHLAGFAATVGALDEDALTSIAFITGPPLLVVPIAAVWLAVEAWRAVRRRRRQTGARPVTPMGH